MKYLVSIAGRTLDVTVDGDRVTVDGTTHRVTLVAIPHVPLRRLVLDGTSRVFVVDRDRHGWLVQLGGERWVAAVEDERTHALREMTGQTPSEGRTGPIRAPMPGLVVRVEVEEGQAVEAGQGVVVLEAMKMENEITTPGAGIVSKVHVSAGQAVEKDAPLVEIAPQG